MGCRRSTAVAPLFLSSFVGDGRCNSVPTIRHVLVVYVWAVFLFFFFFWCLIGCLHVIWCGVK
ncbi:hypothetical protein HanIR_Chr08g0377571 [Helianthus annuus]|nr:hypothetical protein HanIR_Chr08g0377571 [Helianthus annuus]